jgi:glycosyltransferase involved in cell wall biosynthesis
MRFVGMLRVKNEQRWIARVIESILPLCEYVYILDDHSTDGTPEICSSYDQVTVW